jgi:urease accessory protein
MIKKIEHNQTTIQSKPESRGSYWLGGLIQTTDTLFPSGGYAHSYGLEELVSLGLIRTKEQLEEFLIREILPTLERLELPYLRYCYTSAEKQDCRNLLELNEEISSWKMTKEIRNAGMSQGSQMLRMIREIYQCDFSQNFEQILIRNNSTCQQITATALLRKAQQSPLEPTLIAWVYQAVSNFCSASIKLLRLGEVACQKLIHRCMTQQNLDKTISGSLEIKRDEAGFFNPVLDIASARHELAFSRLFIS